MAQVAVQPEFSRPLEVGKAASTPFAISIMADAAESAALARRFDIPAVESLSAELVLAWDAERRCLALAGRVKAKVVQTCVVSLEPIRAEVDVPLQRFYTADVPVETAEELEFDPEAEDPPDLIVGGVIDAGEAVAEQLALSLDPYPRRPEATLPAEYDASTENRESPFAVLRRLTRPN